MSKADRFSDNAGPAFHPVFHYTSPDDVLKDGELSMDEKRVILSSWASDMYAVESNPALRKIPGMARALRLADILSALKRLDDDDPPPRGGMALRPPRLGDLGGIAVETPRRAASRSGALKPRRPMRIALGAARPWTRDDNVRRYRRLLKTQLTDLERAFVERRLAEELGQ